MFSLTCFWQTCYTLALACADSILMAPWLPKTWYSHGHNKLQNNSSFMQHVTHSGPGWTWISEFACQSNGRAVYMALKSHYLGKSHTLRLRSNADKIMETIFYDGKSQLFSYKHYLKKLTQAFIDSLDTG